MPKSTKIPNVRFNLKAKYPDGQETLIALFRYRTEEMKDLLH